jgi:biopolymer transport protein ExbD
MKRHRHQSQREEEVGFQIAPMIDVVFVIMLFFMVQAGNRQVETELKMKLPSTEPGDDASDTPMEEQVAVDQDGAISHNDEPVSQGELKANFKRLAQQAKAEGGTPIIVTITAESTTPWEKVVDVMNAMQFAGIANVTFSVNEEF